MQRTSLVKSPRGPLLLLALICGLWALSEFRADMLGLFTWGGKLQGLASDRGSLLLLTSNLSFGLDHRLRWDHRAASDQSFQPFMTDLLASSDFHQHGRLGFLAAANNSGTPLAVSNGVLGRLAFPGISYRFVIVPYWFLILPAALWAAVRCRAHWKVRRRLGRGRCARCDYDLRESPERCPECGLEATPGASGPRSVLPPPRPRASALWLVVPCMGLLALLLAARFSEARHKAAEANLHASLDRRWDAIRLDTDTAGALRQLGELAGCRVNVRWEKLDPVKITADGPVQLSFHDVSVAQALRALLGSQDGSPPAAAWTVGGPEIVVSAPEDLCNESKVAHVYDIGELRSKIGESVDSWGRDDWNEFAQGLDFDPAETAMVAYCGGDALLVIASELSQARIATELAGLTQSAGHRLQPLPVQPIEIGPSYDSPEAGADPLLAKIDFDGVPAEQAVARLAEMTHLNIAASWDELEMFGFDRRAPVNLHLVHEASTSRILAMLLDCAAVRQQPAETTRQLVMGTPDGFRLGPGSWTQLYDINDMLPRGWNQPSPPLSLALFGPPPKPVSATQPIQNGFTGQGYPDGSGRQACVDTIIKLIEDTVAPDSWRSAGGTVGAVREIAGQGILIVTQSQENQRRIKALLQDLRDHPHLLWSAMEPSSDSATQPTTEPTPQ